MATLGEVVRQDVETHPLGEHALKLNLDGEVKMGLTVSHSNGYSLQAKSYGPKRVNPRDATIDMGNCLNVLDAEPIRHSRVYVLLTNQQKMCIHQRSPAQLKHHHYYVDFSSVHDGQGFHGTTLQHVLADMALHMFGLRFDRSSFDYGATLAPWMTNGVHEGLVIDSHAKIEPLQQTYEPFSPAEHPYSLFDHAHIEHHGPLVTKKNFIKVLIDPSPFLQHITFLLYQRNVSMLFRNKNDGEEVKGLPELSIEGKNLNLAGVGHYVDVAAKWYETLSGAALTDLEFVRQRVES